MLSFTQEDIIDERRLRELLDAVAHGRTDIEAAVAELRDLPYEDIGFAKVDHHRALRDWMPEVILGEGKTAGPDRRDRPKNPGRSRTGYWSRGSSRQQRASCSPRYRTPSITSWPAA